MMDVIPEVGELYRLGIQRDPEDSDQKSEEKVLCRSDRFRVRASLFLGRAEGERGEETDQSPVLRSNWEREEKETERKMNEAQSWPRFRERS